MNVDGSLSDTAVGLHVQDENAHSGGSGRGRKSSPNKSPSSMGSGGLGPNSQYQSGMGKKSNSTSQLSATGNPIKPSVITINLFPQIVIKLSRARIFVYSDDNMNILITIFSINER